MGEEDIQMNKELNEMGDIEEVERQRIADQESLKNLVRGKCKTMLRLTREMQRGGILNPKMTVSELPAFLEKYIRDLRSLEE